MTETYMSNIQEMMTANERQNVKIEYLKRELSDKKQYYDDLIENLRINKQALSELNSKGPNDTVIRMLMDKSEQTNQLLKKYFEQLQVANAQLLMESQMRKEDNLFYTERIHQFEIKISDLRKFLHDKEDSFSNVILRLKKYEDVNDLFLQDKLTGLKLQFEEDVMQDIVSTLNRERNALKNQAQKRNAEMQKMGRIIQAIRQEASIAALKELVSEFDEGGSSFEKTLANHFPPEQTFCKLCDKQNKHDKEKLQKIKPNKELILLLKKEKLSNNILERALSEGIEKNEQLLNYNQKLEHSLELMEKKLQVYRAENALLALKISENSRKHANKMKRGQDDSALISIDHRLRVVDDRIEKYRNALKSGDMLLKETFKVVLDHAKDDVERVRLSPPISKLKGSVSDSEIQIGWDENPFQSQEYIDILEY